MDMFIIVHILLDYYLDTWRWPTARLLNTRSKSIVDKRKVPEDCFGRSSFLRTKWCEICEMNCPDEVWLRYIGDPPGKNRWITHCDSWKCRLSAIKSMIADYKINQNAFVLRVPLDLPDKIDVPRSDGSVTEGASYMKFLVVEKHGQKYIPVYWFKGMEKYDKLVPLSYYTNEKPKLMFN